MKVQEIGICAENSSIALDTLISSFSSKEAELKHAIFRDFFDQISDLDYEISSLEFKIRNYRCKSALERKQLIMFYLDNYFDNDEVKTLLPTDVLKEIRKLIV